MKRGVMKIQIGKSPFTSPLRKKIGDLKDGA